MRKYIGLFVAALSVLALVNCGSGDKAGTPRMQNYSGNEFRDGIKTDTISEQTAAAGVTIDGVLCKDSVVTAAITGNAATATKLATARAIGGADFDGTAAITPGTPLNTASTTVARDSSGNFSAGTITASLTGNASGSSGSCTGNAATATTATTANSIAAASVFLSTEQTGNGSEQSIAHGLGSVPAVVIAIPSTLTAGVASGVAITYGTHTTTEAKVTATNGEKYKVLCIK